MTIKEIRAITGLSQVKFAEKYGIPHASTGDLFRENLKNETELGKLGNFTLSSPLI